MIESRRIAALVFGANAPSLHEQLGLKAGDLANEQRLADAIVLCAGHELLTAHEQRYLNKRIVKRINGRFAAPPKPRPQDTRWIPAREKEGPLPVFAERWLAASDTPLGRWIAQLSERQLCVLEYRHLNEKPGKTLKAIGKEYGVSGTTIRSEEHYLYRRLFNAACGSCEADDGAILRFPRRDAAAYQAMRNEHRQLRSDWGAAVPIGDGYAEQSLQAFMDRFPGAAAWTERERRMMRSFFFRAGYKRHGWRYMHFAVIAKTRETLTAHLRNGRISDAFAGRILAELDIAPRYQRAWVEHVGGFRRAEDGNGWIQERAGA